MGYMSPYELVRVPKLDLVLQAARVSLPLFLFVRLHQSHENGLRGPQLGGSFGPHFQEYHFRPGYCHDYEASESYVYGQVPNRVSRIREVRG